MSRVGCQRISLTSGYILIRPLRIGQIQKTQQVVEVDAGKRQPMSKEGPAIRTSGVRGVPQAGGIKNATLRYDLPPPAVAVRNLVRFAFQNWNLSSGSIHSLQAFPDRKIA